MSDVETARGVRAETENFVSISAPEPDDTVGSSFNTNGDCYPLSGSMKAELRQNGNPVYLGSPGVLTVSGGQWSFSFSGVAAGNYELRVTMTSPVPQYVSIQITVA